ncbi:MAG: hypothetical protein LC121_22325 [Anaerolineae bacterium]|nr:hypothetical protein [Anaerolineae bacterium]
MDGLIGRFARQKMFLLQRIELRFDYSLSSMSVNQLADKAPPQWEFRSEVEKVNICTTYVSRQPLFSSYSGCNQDGRDRAPDLSLPGSETAPGGGDVGKVTDVRWSIPSVHKAAQPHINAHVCTP